MKLPGQPWQSNFRLFTKVMHLYFMGIGGTAMGSVAILLQRKGHRISGADLNLYPPMSTCLETAGIHCFEGYDEKRLEALKPDLVVVGNVIGRGNAEAEWLLETRAIPFISLPELIGKELIGKRPSIVVSGTHGKTTTTALAAHLLRENGQQPGYLIAGVPLNGESSADGAGHAPFVIEGDEYDSAFFDKRSKFIHYLPRTLLINNLEFDHGDIFRDLEDIRRSFSHLLRLVPRNGHVLVNADDATLVQWVCREAHARVWKIGFSENADLRIVAFEEHGIESSFELQLEGRPWLNVQWGLAASYNARNAAMAAWASALQICPQDPAAVHIKGFESFRGVMRRQQVRLQQGDRMLIEDFGHHPTAIRETVQSFRNRFPRHLLFCAFEPRSNTSRSAVFQSLWPDAFAAADAVWIGAIHRAHLLSTDQCLDRGRLCRDLAERGVHAQSFDDHKVLLDDLLKQLPFDPQAPVLLLFFSNGSFDGIVTEAVSRLTQRTPSPAP
jgi:UDP-N-acetylmuramate: L-alanyl-gamma-D-glutamyl-meso-diaminopimelate ligase